MDILLDSHGLHFLLRWLHLLAGIAWIGMLYYFNLVQTPFFGKADAAPANDALKAVKGGMVRNVVPVALWWFRWGAMFTFLSGLAILGLAGHQGGMGVYSQSFLPQVSKNTAIVLKQTNVNVSYRVQAPARPDSVEVARAR